MDNTTGGKHSGMQGRGSTFFIRSERGEIPYLGNLRCKFFVSLELALLIVALSPSVGLWSKFPAAEWGMLGLSFILFFYGIISLANGVKYEISRKAPAAITLATLAIGLAFFYSIYAFIANKLAGELVLRHFLPEIAVVTAIMLLVLCIKVNAFSAADKTADSDEMLVESETVPLQADEAMEQASFEIIASSSYQSEDDSMAGFISDTGLNTPDIAVNNALVAEENVFAEKSAI